MNLSQLKAVYTDLSQYVDVEDGLNRIRKNKKVYRTVLSSFIQNTHYDDLSEQLARGDAEAARVTAHTIKGLAANLSLPMLLKQTLELQNRLKSVGASGLPRPDELGKAMAKTIEYIGIVLQHLDDMEF